ncbi:hypothetical protein HD554DRAFT_2105189 [Boletus coccyginus]|nr:hypothetical protein HD554DRAFT_2105189 [Boletus coccyginus]
MLRHIAWHTVRTAWKPQQVGKICAPRMMSAKPNIMMHHAQSHTHSMPSAKRKQKRRGGKHRAHTSNSPLEDFFATYYPRFEYDATESASDEFHRLCDELGWGREDAKRKVAHRNFKDALVKQFNEIYGTDADDLGEWQKLCHIVDIYPIPDNLKACREAISGTYVNLVDLIQVGNGVTGKEVQLFDSERELSEYTCHTGKYFPKENAYAGGFLRYLLRHILEPTEKVPSRHGSRKRR